MAAAAAPVSALVSNGGSPRESARPDSDLDLKRARVLVVGAGGIGCEVVKTLVLSGLRRLSIIDMDSIDVTNLNRQFLFRREHVGLSKAKVLAQAARRLVPSVSAEEKVGVCEAESAEESLNFEAFPPPGEFPSGYCMSLFDSRITALSLKQFDIVFSCLDNVAARRHLNRLAASAETPLIEAGSAAENGQTTPIVAGVTTCFECSSNKPAPPKKIPICTLRQRPETATHCVAWAKLLYEGLWGAECRRLGGEESLGGAALNELVLRTRSQASITDEALALSAREAFSLLFEKEIQELVALKKDSWGSRPPPVALTLETTPLEDTPGKNSNSCATTADATRLALTPGPAQRLFIRSFCALTSRQMKMDDEIAAAKESDAAPAAFPFDKDDEDAMDFVAAAASLRMANFHIPPTSRWELQSIAGKIVPAIAATNAIVAGLQVIQGLHLLRFLAEKKSLLEQRQQQCALAKGEETAPSGQSGRFGDLIDGSPCRQVWVKPFASGRRPEEFGILLVAEKLEPLKGDCFVCQQQRVTVRVASFKALSVFQFFQQVLIESLGCHAPFVDAANNLVDPDRVEEEPEYAELLKKQTLADAGLGNGSLLTVTDFSQGSFQCDVFLVEDSALAEKGDLAAEAFALDFKANAPKTHVEDAADAKTVGAGDADSTADETNSKRKQTASADSPESGCKKAKTASRGAEAEASSQVAVDAQSDEDCLVLDV